MIFVGILIFVGLVALVRAINASTSQRATAQVEVRQQTVAMQNAILIERWGIVLSEMEDILVLVKELAELKNDAKLMAEMAMEWVVLKSKRDSDLQGKVPDDLSLRNKSRFDEALNASRIFKIDLAKQINESLTHRRREA